jgi:small subunit ribosomal protein S8
MNITKFIIILNNAIKANKLKIVVKSSKKIMLLLEVLYKENFILGYKKLNACQTIIFLKVNYKHNCVRSLKKIGKPSFLVHISYKDLWPFMISLNTLILNTPKGVLTHREAVKACCGGIVVCALF